MILDDGHHYKNILDTFSERKAKTAEIAEHNKGYQTKMFKKVVGKRTRYSLFRRID